MKDLVYCTSSLSCKIGLEINHCAVVFVLVDIC